MKYLVVGLGNIGAEYAETRHNIGFKVLDRLAAETNTSFISGRYGSVAEFRHRGHIVTLLKPSTYMNLSGKAVRYWLTELKIDKAQLLVVVDDIALPFGELRIRKKGSAGGHNGLKNIIEYGGSDQFPRIRIGVGAKPTPEYDLAAWVTGKMPAEDKKAIEDRFGDIEKAIPLILAGEFEKAMCLYNK